MPSTTPLNCLSSALETVVLSWTPYARLATVAAPKDLDAILKRTLRELKFHIESLLAILFFMATTMMEDPGVVKVPLISWTLACLLYTLLIHIVLDAVSAEALHDWLEEFPGGRHLLACMAKLPALSVVATLFALALTSWPSIFTLVICCIVASALIVMLAIRLRLHHAAARCTKTTGEWVRRAFGRGKSSRREDKRPMQGPVPEGGQGIAKMADDVRCTVVVLTCPSEQV